MGQRERDKNVLNSQTLGHQQTRAREKERKKGNPTPPNFSRLLAYLEGIGLPLRALSAHISFHSAHRHRNIGLNIHFYRTVSEVGHIKSLLVRVEASILESWFLYYKIWHARFLPISCLNELMLLMVGGCMCRVSSFTLRVMFEINLCLLLLFRYGRGCYR